MKYAATLESLVPDDMLHSSPLQPLTSERSGSVCFHGDHGADVLYCLDQHMCGFVHIHSSVSDACLLWVACKSEYCIRFLLKMRQIVFTAGSSQSHFAGDAPAEFTRMEVSVLSAWTRSSSVWLISGTPCRPRSYVVRDERGME